MNKLPLHDASRFRLELACFDVASAIMAAAAGADRLELCAAYASGGLTPPLAWLSALRPAVAVPVHVMLRPAEGGFCYSAEQFAVMKKQLREFKAAGANGFVFGLLDGFGLVDVPRNRELVELARPLPCTFHRAFDGLADQPAALECLVDLGFGAVLTSGNPGPALDSKEIISKLVEQAGGRICVIPGGGIRSGNVAELLRATQARWYHSAARGRDGSSLEADEVKGLCRVLSACDAPGYQ